MDFFGALKITMYRFYHCSTVDIDDIQVQQMDIRPNTQNNITPDAEEKFTWSSLFSALKTASFEFFFSFIRGLHAELY